MNRHVIIFQGDEPSLLLENIWPAEGQPRSGRVVNGMWNWPHDALDSFDPAKCSWADTETCYVNYNDALLAAKGIVQHNLHAFTADWEPAPLLSSLEIERDEIPF